MFWGCFTYHFKGLYHIWKQQSKKEQKEATRILNIWNQSLEPAAYQIWQQEVTQKRQDYELRHKRKPTGRQPTWKFTAERGAFKRKSKGGIDWWRYLTFVLLPKLLPFAQGLQCLYPGIIVQEDKAPSHTARIHQTYYNAVEVQRLIWPRNSPDLNMIEPAWGYLKRVTTQKGPL
jgi:DDE superfamily endonuclease